MREKGKKTRTNEKSKIKNCTSNTIIRIDWTKTVGRTIDGIKKFLKLNYENNRERRNQKKKKKQTF